MNQNYTIRLRDGTTIEFSWNSISKMWFATLSWRKDLHSPEKMATFSHARRSKMIRAMRLRIAQWRNDKITKVIKRVRPSSGQEYENDTFTWSRGKL